MHGGVGGGGDGWQLSIQFGQPWQLVNPHFVPERGAASVGLWYSHQSAHPGGEGGEGVDGGGGGWQLSIQFGQPWQLVYAHFVP